jgi:hypothetical protein
VVSSVSGRENVFVHVMLVCTIGVLLNVCSVQFALSFA